MLKSVPIADLDPNPYRRLDEYEIIREKVDALKRSIEDTGFWGTIVARPHGRRYQIAFGHHRLVALRELYANGQATPVIVRDLSNEKMLKMMAAENMEEWGTSAWVELETIRATIDAYGRDEIALPPIPKNARSDTIRHVIQKPRSHPYTKATVAEFLDWTVKIRGGVKPNYACDIAFQALDMIDAGFLDERLLRGKKRAEMAAIVEGQWKVYEAEMQAAAENREEADRARRKAETEPEPARKEAFRRQAQVHEEQATSHTAAAKQKAVDFGKAAAETLARGEGTAKVKKEARAWEQTPSPAVTVQQTDDEAIRLARKLERIGDGEDAISDIVDYLRGNLRFLSDDCRNSVHRSFEACILRLRRMQALFKESPTDHHHPRSHPLGLENRHAEED